jgi:hypothetical protein
MFNIYLAEVNSLCVLLVKVSFDSTICCLFSLF